jgi:SOS-response transcriptional repressor LexA
MVSLPKVKPEWPGRIAALMQKHRLTQAALAQRLGVSSATVSRWMKGTHEPTGAAYVALGNLAGPPDDVYFWEQAGINSSGFAESRSRVLTSSLKVKLGDFRFVTGRKLKKSTVADKGNAVAIPLLNITAYGDEVPPEQHVRIGDARIEEVLTVPLSWCPHPEAMICVHMTGDSMLPIIDSGTLLAVDTEVTDKDTLLGKIVLASHRNLGFKVALLQRLPSADILVPANHRYAPIDIANDTKWSIFGQVLWWLTRPPVVSPEADTQSPPASPREHKQKPHR